MRFKFGIHGFHTLISGKINGKSRAFKYSIRFGRVAINTLSYSVNYEFCPSYSVFGTFGIKI